MDRKCSRIGRSGIALMMLVAAACESESSSELADQAATPSIVVTDDAGRAVTLDAPARRIISLLPGTTETLVALGARDYLVGRTDYDDPSLADLPSVGGGLTPNLEQIASLRPDLVIAWEEAGSARIRPRLEQLGISVFAAQTRDTAAIFSNFERLGQLTGTQVAADSLLALFRSELAAIRDEAAVTPRRSVLYLVGVDPPIAAGPDLFIGELVSVAGGDNVFTDLPTESAQVSMEAILDRRPEIVILPQSSGSPDPRPILLSQPGWASLVEGGSRLITLPADVLHQPGPAILEAARLLRGALQPDSAEFDG